ncbi:MAG: hypothetical protein EGS53_12200 [Prevotella sp.]|nr:hypothetical protein [Prevotella sp.]
MKTKKLTLLLTAAMFLMGGHNAVKADTTLLTKEDGWQKITSISQGEIDQYYYVFVDKDKDLMLGLANGVKNTKRKAMFYQKGVNVVEDKSKLWAIEKNGEYYALRNASVDNYLQMQTEWGDNNPAWDTNDQPNACEWTGVRLEYTDGAWSIISTKNTRALGVYGDEEKVPAENDEIGANSNGKGQKFLIYAIPRSTYYAKLTKGASKDTPKDLSWAIKNNTLDDNQANRGWNLTCTGWHNFNNTYGVGEYYTNVDQPNFELSQTLTGLQPGIYQLSAQLFEDVKRDVYLFGNERKVCVQETDNSAGTEKVPMERVANLMKADPNYGMVTVSVLVDEDGKLRLGLCGNGPATTWVVFDNFQLQYMGNEKEDICKIKYQEVQDKAKELLYNPVYAQIQGRDKGYLEKLANADANSVITVNNYETKKQELETAMTTFQEDKEVYNTFVSHVENANLFGKEALGLTEIPTVDKVSDATITGEKLRELRSQMYEAEYDYVMNNYTSDITSLKGIDGWNGWTKSELAANNWQSYAGDFQDPKYYEVKGGFDKIAKWEESLSRSITLSPGKYVVKLACRTSYNGGASSGYVSVKVGDTETKANFPLKNDTGYGITTSGEASFDGSKDYNSTGRQGGGWEWRYVPFELNSTSEVTLTIHVASEGGNNYPGFYEPQLLAMPINVTLADTKTYDKAPALVANVTLDRKLGEKWNTIVLPFALNEAQVTEMFGEGAKVAAYKGSTVNGDHVTLNFKEQTSMEAQTPYMIKPGTDASKKVNGVILESASELKKVEDANHNGIDFVGNYTTGQTLQQNSFFISNNVFYRASGQETMKAYRATFQVPTSTTAKIMNTVFVGEGGSVTAIDDVHVSPQGSFDVYHINGMLVKKNAIDLNGLDKGIYIINGKKYVVK